MTLNIKKFWKKFACLGASAFMALSLGSSLVKAATPVSNLGIQYGTPVTINKGTLTVIGQSVAKYNITLADSPLTYNGSPHNIIKSAAAVGDHGGTTLYLRVDNSTDAKSNGSDWIAVAGANVTEEAPLQHQSLTMIPPGTYYVFYYIDGGLFYDDLSSTTGS